MTSQDYLKYRALQKRAGGIPVLGDILKSITAGLSGAGKEVTSAALDSAKLAIPATAVGLAYLLARAQSPKAVADNAHEYAINAMEKESLAQSIRDMEDAAIVRKLTSGKRKFHDQFI